MPKDAKLFGTLDTADNLYKKSTQGERKLSVMPSIVKSRIDSVTHAIMNHSNYKTIEKLKTVLDCVRKLADAEKGIRRASE